MITATGLAVESGHGLGGYPLHFASFRHHSNHLGMTLGNPPVVPPEFVRPLPKPAPVLSRYNNVPSSKYPVGPVNLSQQQTSLSRKEDEDDYLVPSSFGSSPRLFSAPHPPFHSYRNLAGPYGALFPAHYAPLPVRDRTSHPPAPNPPLSPLEAYPGPRSAPESPAATYSPPSVTSLKTHNNYRKFKVPTGKEGSLKHRILTTTAAAATPPSYISASTSRSEADPITSATSLRSSALPSSNSTGVSSPSSATSASSSRVKRKRSLDRPSLSFEDAEKFVKGCLIELGNGALKKVEDMRTEDFISSVRTSSGMTLNPSTVVRIEPSPSDKTSNRLTLTYGKDKQKVELVKPIEHPYYVYGQGWASCSPEKTMAVFGLQCHKLQVGDICISLLQTSDASSTSSRFKNCNSNNESSLSVPGGSSSLVSNKKRRWSAPDQFEATPPPPTLSNKKSE